MTTRMVHWFEGMFLKPQHFQTEQRHLLDLIRRGDKSSLHHDWGLKAFDLDLDALANHRFVVRSLQARFRDGAVVSVPEDRALSALDLKPLLEDASSLTVYLGVPILSLGRANVNEDGRSDGSRYLMDTQELEDENTGVDPQPIHVRLPNLRLLTSSQDLSGYEILPLARIEKSAQADAVPQLDATYIPPLLTCDAWQLLREGIFQSLFDRVGKKVDLLAEQVQSKRIQFGAVAQGEAMVLAQLRELNEASVLLDFLAHTPGLHPTLGYLELCLLVGRLAIFGESRRTPPLPHYDHDDLGPCFYRVKQYLDSLLEVFVEPEYKERPFIGAGLRMQAPLDASWLDPSWQMFIGVHCSQGVDECVRLLTRPGQFDMKIASAERVDEVFRMGLPGMKFEFVGQPPRVLPTGPDIAFFRLQRDEPAAEWRSLQRSLSLAIRLNEKLIVGNIQGQRTLTIRAGQQNMTMAFTLFVVPQEKR